MKRMIIRRPVNDAPALSGFPPILQRVYSARGVKRPEELKYDLSSLLHYQGLLGLEQAVNLLASAVVQQQRILIVGDFDADGATSTALAVTALTRFGASYVSYLVPNRFEYGYGLTPEIVAVALKYDPQLIVTVDNGISSHAGVEAAKAAGVHVIITDHHLPPPNLPMADAIVNPQQVKDTFLSKHLAGVGVIFYVMVALRTRLREMGWFSSSNLPEPEMVSFLDLVALGTIADLVTLDHNNRVMVQQGLQRIRLGKSRIGIQALLRVAERRAEYLVSSDLAFAIAPRLNAAGRLKDMSLGIECLLATDFNRAYNLALQLDALNKERRHIETNMQEQALLLMERLAISNTEPGICLFDDRWHQGIVGILASRLKERFHKPAIVFAPGMKADELKGSARSVAGVHIRDLLAVIAIRHPNLIDCFGGHAMAAGLTLQRSVYEFFAEAFFQELQDHLKGETLGNELYSDGALDQGDFTCEWAGHLRSVHPWGQGFSEPIFDGCFRLLDDQFVGAKHIKMTLALEQSNQIVSAIAFNMEKKDWFYHRKDYLKMAYRLHNNCHRRGYPQSLELIVEAFSDERAGD